MSRKENRARLKRRAVERSIAQTERVADAAIRRITQDGIIPLHRAIAPYVINDTIDVRAMRGALADVPIDDLIRGIEHRAAKMRDVQLGIRYDNLTREYRRYNNRRIQAWEDVLDDAGRIVSRAGGSNDVQKQLYVTYAGYVAPRDSAYGVRRWVCVTARLPSKQDVWKDLYRDRAFRAVIQDMVLVRFTEDIHGTEPTRADVSDDWMRRRMGIQSKVSARKQHDAYLASRLHAMRVRKGIAHTAQW